MRSTWAVVLVHGVGDTQAGATLCAFLPEFLKARPALTENDVPQQRLLVEPAPKLPHSSETQPAPPSDETEAGPERRFPMYQRTFSVDGARHGEPSQVALAEVFWADLSKAGDKWWLLLLRAISLVFDLRHVADVAASVTGLKWAARLRRVLYWVSWLICGPVAGFTAFSLVLLLAHYGAVRAFEWAGASAQPLLREGAVVAFGALVVAALWFCKGRFRDFFDETWHQFASWIQIAAALAALVGVLRLALGPSFPWATAPGRWLASRLLLEDSALGSEAGTTVTHLGVTLGWGYFFFTLLAGVTFIAFAVWVLARREARSRQLEAAAPALDAALAASLLQVTLWVLMGTGLGWIVLDRLMPDYNTVLRTVVVGFTAKLFVVTAIVLCAVVVWGLRRLRRGKALKTDAELPRLLLHPLVLGALIGLTLLSSLLFAEAFVTGSARLHEWLAPWTRSLQWLSLAAAGISLFLGKGVGAALHIVLDITGHFHRQKLDRARTKVEAADFVIQQRIEARCRRVLQEVLRFGDVTHVTIVAHSQGTMIALDVLWLKWAAELLKDKTVYLVTMGSPITYLYQHYFPHRYPPLFVDGQLNPEWGSQLNRTVQEWINIYRIDDFVGTRVTGGPDFPRNAWPIGTGGHTGYWKDEKALALMARYLPPLGGAAVGTASAAIRPAA